MPTAGKQERAGAELYMLQHGDTVAGKKIVLEVKDDTGAADVTKRIAEELIGNDHAKALMGLRVDAARARHGAGGHRSEGSRGRQRGRNGHDH